MKVTGPSATSTRVVITDVGRRADALRFRDRKSMTAADLAPLGEQQHATDRVVLETDMPGKPDTHRRPQIQR